MTPFEELWGRVSEHSILRHLTQDTESGCIYGEQIGCDVFSYGQGALVSSLVINSQTLTVRNAGFLVCGLLCWHTELHLRDHYQGCGVVDLTNDLAIDCGYGRLRWDHM